MMNGAMPSSGGGGHMGQMGGQMGMNPMVMGRMPMGPDQVCGESLSPRRKSVMQHSSACGGGGEGVRDVPVTAVKMFAVLLCC